MKISTIALAASGWIALAATHLPPSSLPRVLITVSFVIAGPGLAAVRFAEFFPQRRTRSYEPGTAAVLAVAVSIALATLISEALVLADAFTMTRCMFALATLTTLLASAPELVIRRGGDRMAQYSDGSS